MKKVVCFVALCFMTVSSFAENTVCNSDAVNAGLLTKFQNGIAQVKFAGPVGVFIPIKSNCTETNVCKFTTSTITGWESNLFSVFTNNNAQTSLLNGGHSFTESNVFYAYYHSADAAQCLLVGGADNFDVTLKLNWKYTRESAPELEKQGVVFN